MPRQKAPQAERETKRAQEARFRFLIRNPEFRKDLQSLQNRLKRKLGWLSSNQDYEGQTRIASKWGIPFLPEFISLPRSETEQITYLEKCWHRSQGAALSFPSVSVVKSDAPFIEIRVNYQDHPVAELLPLIEQELKGTARRFASRRRRLDKIDFQLRIYDLASEGKTFSEIANALRRRLSTVKSAYLAAMRQIFGASNVAGKKDVTLKGFDLASHLQTCDVCRQAQNKFEEFCPKTRLYVNQDTKGQKELTGYDTKLR